MGGQIRFAAALMLYRVGTSAHPTDGGAPYGVMETDSLHDGFTGLLSPRGTASGQSWSKKNAAVYAASSDHLLPGLRKYLKNSEFESITITSPCALKLAR